MSRHESILQLCLPFLSEAGVDALLRDLRERGDAEGAERLSLLFRCPGDDLESRAEEMADDEDAAMYLGVHLWRERHGTLHRRLRAEPECGTFDVSWPVLRGAALAGYDVLGMTVPIHEPSTTTIGSGLDAALARCEAGEGDQGDDWYSVAAALLAVANPRLQGTTLGTRGEQFLRHVVTSWWSEPGLRYFEMSYLPVLVMDAGCWVEDAWPILAEGAIKGRLDGLQRLPGLLVAVQLYGSRAAFLLERVSSQEEPQLIAKIAWASG